MRDDSFILSWCASISLKSAGTIVPASNNTISPATKFLVLIFLSEPPRITKHSGCVSLFSASSDFSALYSCATPKIAFIKTIARMIIPSIISFMVFSTIPITIDTAAAIKRMIIIRS